MTASGVSKLHVLATNQTVRAKYNQESILSLFLPDEMYVEDPWYWKSYRKKIYENMLDLTLLQDGAPAHKATETQIWSETIFSRFQIKD